MKKIISLFMSILMLMLCVFQINVLADENAPMIIVESVSDSPGATVDVAVKVKNNPGILGATLTFTYDKELTLVDATAGDAFSVLTMTKRVNTHHHVSLLGMDKNLVLMILKTELFLI